MKPPQHSTAAGAYTSTECIMFFRHLARWTSSLLSTRAGYRCVTVQLPLLLTLYHLLPRTSWRCGKYPHDLVPGVRSALLADAFTWVAAAALGPLRAAAATYHQEEEQEMWKVDISLMLCALYSLRWSWSLNQCDAIFPVNRMKCISLLCIFSPMFVNTIPCSECHCQLAIFILLKRSWKKVLKSAITLTVFFLGAWNFVLDLVQNTKSFISLSITNCVASSSALTVE